MATKLTAHPNPQGVLRALNAKAGDVVVRAFCLALPGGDAPPQWIPYLPAPDANGRVTGEDGRWWIVKNATALCAAVKRKLPIDINHSTETAAKNGGESPAAGWMPEFQVRDDGSIWAKASWNTRGSNALKEQDYGFISPTFDFDPKTRAITRLVSAALVNEPNFSSLALNGRQTPEETAMLESILAALGLAKDAAADEAIRAINSLKNEVIRATNAAATPDLTKFVPRADHDAVVQRATNAENQLAADKKARTDAEIETEIADALKGGKITPATVDYHRANCAREGGLEQFRAFCKAAPTVAPDLLKPAPDAVDASGLTDNQRALCAALGIDSKLYAESLKASTARAH